MPRPSLLVRHAHVLTMTERGEILDGYLAVDGDRQLAVGPDECRCDDANRVIDGPGRAALPGFLNAHTHVIRILMRGGVSDDRRLYDWLFNVVLPGLSVYRREDAELAARFYCAEAVRAGITTFVDNVEFLVDRFGMAVKTALGVYQEVGLRVVYARMFYYVSPPRFDELIAATEAREPSVSHDPGGFETAASALAAIEELITRFHGAADGRIQVWLWPGLAIFCSPEGLLGAKVLAQRRGTPPDSWPRRVEARPAASGHVEHRVSGVDRLSGPRGAGWVLRPGRPERPAYPAPAQRQNNGVCNISWAAASRRSLKCSSPDSAWASELTTPTATTASTCCPTSKSCRSRRRRSTSGATRSSPGMLEMATIDGARALGVEHEVGSLEPGKKADLLLIDLDRRHLYPRAPVPSVLVYQANGSEVGTVVVDGRILLDGGRLTGAEPPTAGVQTAPERIALDARLTGRASQRARRPVSTRSPADSIRVS